MSVFVLDRSDRALIPCSQKRARKMLRSARARVDRLMPFVIRLIDRQVANFATQALRIKLDPGSKTIGLALVRDVEVVDTQDKVSLRDSAAVNTTRWALANALKAIGLPIELSSGGRIKFNRPTLNVPKTHALDAACVGVIAAITNWQQPTLQVKCMGRGSYQRTRLGKCGFPRGYLMRNKQVKGFATDDTVKAVVPKGVKLGEYQGRVYVRASGSFNIQKKTEVVQGISHKHCQVLQRSDGFGYFLNPKIASQDVSLGRLAGVALSLPGMNAGVSRAIN